jgi:lycopene cyclase domain-containing protein
MTYFGVLTLFILPPLLVLLVRVPRDVWQTLRSGERPSRAMLLPYWIVLAHVALALIYTTPWDNYLVATGVWYYNPALVTGITLGYVPIEEYTFFILQTLLTGLWVLGVQRRLAAQRPEFKAQASLRWIASLVVGMLWMISTILFFAGWQAGTYLTLILSWALIPVLIQVAFGADILRRRWREVALGITAPTLYLWVVDAIAIRSGTWTIDPAQTTGVMLGSLPVEEMVFFFMTNLIIVFGMTLMLAEESQQRAQELLSTWRAWRASRKTTNPRSERGTRALKIALAVWLLALIATPISLWLFGEGIFPVMAALGVLAQLGAVLLAVSLSWSSRRILGALAFIAAITWTVEWLGSTTGFIFGHYDYTQAMQPQLAGVPLVIPLAWAMMLFPAWAVAQAILVPYQARLGRLYLPIFAALSGLAFTAWDLYLDPQMVARGLWVWQNPVGLFGIPLANFAGWWLVATLLTLIVRPSQLPVAPLLLIYTLTWLFQAVGLGVFWDQAGPALTGFLGMGIFCLWAWRQIDQPWQDVLAWMPFVTQAVRTSPEAHVPSPAIAEHE